MVYAPELFNTNLTDPFAPTTNPNDFGDGTNRFVELFNLARKQEKEKAKDGSGDKALKKSFKMKKSPTYQSFADLTIHAIPAPLSYYFTECFQPSRPL